MELQEKTHGLTAYHQKQTEDYNLLLDRFDKIANDNEKTTKELERSKYAAL